MIVLHQRSGNDTDIIAEIADQHVHFAFASGRLSYNCASCGYTCCKGHGYLLNIQDETELLAQFDLSPLVRFFLNYDAANEQESGVQVGNLPPGCFFLGADGACAIQREHGYEAKPETCRMFPFNNLARVGDRLLVSPHPTLCPLQISTGELAPSSNHATLLKDMGMRGITTKVSQLQPSVDVPVDDLLQLEAHIRDSGHDHLKAIDYVDFATHQLTLTTAALEGPDHPIAAGQQVVRDFVDRAALILGTTIELEDQELTQILTVATPWLRLGLLFHSEDRLAQRMGFTALDITRVPLMIMGLYLVARLARQAGMDRVTIQTINQLAGRFQNVVFLLAHADIPMAWKQTEALDSPKTADESLRFRYMKTVRALSRRKQEKKPQPLVDVILAMAPEAPLERTKYLIELAQVLKYKIEPLESTPEEAAQVAPS